MCIRSGCCIRRRGKSKALSSKNVSIRCRHEDGGLEIDSASVIEERQLGKKEMQSKNAKYTLIEHKLTHLPPNKMAPSKIL